MYIPTSPVYLQVEAGGTLGIPVTVYCQQDVSQHKKDALLDRGVRVVLHGNDCVEAENEARASAKVHHMDRMAQYIYKPSREGEKN